MTDAATRDSPTPENLRARIDELERQGVVDNYRIKALQRSARVDRELIDHLRAEGIIDKGKIANLETALVTARRIAAAMGVMMNSRHVTDDQAFDLLRTASQRTHRKLRDVAEDVLLTGTTEN